MTRASAIREVSGDILLSKADAIAHGVAPNDDFGQGLALALRTRWPAMYKAFRRHCHNHHPGEGTAWVWSGPDGVRVVNLMTQAAAFEKGARPGKATTHNVLNAIKALRGIIETEGIRSVALPRLATGVGGLDWSDVQPLIDQFLGDLPIPVYVYSEFRPGEQAEEG